MEAHTTLKQLHDSLVETQEWLSNIEDEVERIAEGTVILGTSDVSELQPVFEQLYIRWQVEKGLQGRCFKEWRSLSYYRKLEREKLIIEKVITRLQTCRTSCLQKMWIMWKQGRKRKSRNKQIKISKDMIKVFSAKVWSLDHWKGVCTKHKASRVMTRKMLRQVLVRSYTYWSHLSVERALAKVRRQKAEKMTFKKVCSYLIHAWYFCVVRRNQLRMKLKSSQDFMRVQTQTKNYNAWNFLRQKNKYQTQGMKRKEFDRRERCCREWRLVARHLKTIRNRSGFLSRRIVLKLKDQMFQMYCEGIEEEIIKKIKVNRMRSQSRIFWLRGTFGRWAWCAHVTESGVGNFKVRRTFKALKRYIVILKAQHRVHAKWTCTNNGLLKVTVLDSHSSFPPFAMVACYAAVF